MRPYFKRCLLVSAEILFEIIVFLEDSGEIIKIWYCVEDCYSQDTNKMNLCVHGVRYSKVVEHLNLGYYLY